MENSTAIGIYFGEDDLVMARVINKDFRILENQDNEPITPAVVYITEDHEPVVGKMALSYGGIDSKNIIRDIQHLIGRDSLDPTVQDEIMRASYQAVPAKNGEIEIVLRERNYSIIDLASFLFASLKRDAEMATDQSVSQAVISVPAYFDDRRKEAVRKAGEKAGLTVMQILPEPTAVGLAYGMDNNTEKPKVFLVYSLNKRSFDVTVMRCVAGRFTELGKTGDMHLGGDDFNHLIIDWMIEQARMEHHIDPVAWRNNPQIMWDLKNYAEQTTYRLSKMAQVQIAIPAITKNNESPLNLNYKLSRDQFNALIHPLVDRSIDLVSEALRKANTTMEEIDAVLLAGSSTRVPLVEERLREVFGQKVVRSNINPAHCIAQGAAIQTLVPPETVPNKAEPEIVVEAEPVAATPEEPPQVLDQPVLCTCGVLNPAGRTTCCFCGVTLAGAEQKVKKPAKKPEAPPKAPATQPKTLPQTPAQKEPVVIDTDETWIDLDGTMMHSVDEDK